MPLNYSEIKRPSYLKGLVDTYARAKGDVLRLTAILETVQGELAAAQAAVDSCETLIHRFDEQLATDTIEPMRAWRGRYGPRGVFRRAVLEEVQRAAPDEVTTTQLAAVLALRFKLDFPTWRERKEWRRSTLGDALRDLVAEGKIERLHDPDAADGATGRWRWIDPDGPAGSAGAMAALAAAAGVEVDDEADGGVDFPAPVPRTALARQRDAEPKGSAQSWSVDVSAE